MTVYKAPLRDMHFVMNEVLDYPAHYRALPCGEEASGDLIDAILSECARFSEEILAPLNSIGDEQGCRLEDGTVITPDGFKEAYAQWQAGGWQGLSHPEEYGGQGLPLSLGVLKSEMVGTANWSWGMYPGLSIGAMNTVFAHGTEAQKKQYLPKLCDASWTGTMCLTEPHCGSDLAQLKSKAELNDDGSYSITGTKIFISSGDHDLCENIIHIVIARIPGSPEGTKGISLFIVPKILVDEQGELLEPNAVSCGSLEKKMGIHGNATAVLNFDGAKGFLLGSINEGMACMFTFMNTARVGTAIQGVAAAELAYQNSLPYATERYSMRSLSGHKNPDKPGDAIIHHPDVRRLLLTQKAIAEGGRAMLYDAARMADFMVYGRDDDEKADAENYLGFMTPILKGFLTEMGNECASHGMQVFGGHGYITEHGMEQIYRDSRISTLYEGTTGIQAMDLMGRKIILDGFKLFWRFSKQFYGQGFKAMLTGKRRRYGAKLLGSTLRWNWLIAKMLARASRNRDAVGAASYDFLMYSGYLSLSHYWSKMAEAAALGLENDPDNADFYNAKLATADFWFERMLPRAQGHAASMDRSTRSVMDLHVEQFGIR